jgi:hypothetical protein
MEEKTRWVGEALASLSGGRPAFAEAASRRQAEVAPTHCRWRNTFRCLRVSVSILRGLIWRHCT